MTIPWMKAYLSAIPVLLILGLGGPALAAQEVLDDGETSADECCFYCHCEPVPETTGLCGDWPGDPVCRTFKETWCWQVEPGGVGASSCVEWTTYWYYS